MDIPRPQRRSIRLPGYDYAQPGAYFVTLIAHQRRPLFGAVVAGAVALSPDGRIVQEVWQALPRHFPRVVLDAFVVMPNHIHGVIIIRASGQASVGEADIAAGGLAGEAFAGANASPLQVPVVGRADWSAGLPEAPRGTRPGSLAAIVQSFKSTSTRRINQARRTAGAAVWQRSFYEHVVRDEHALERIRQYILTNPAQWAQDPEHRP